MKNIQKPDILVNPITSPKYSGDGIVKIKTDKIGWKSLLKYESNVDSLKNNIIPVEWGTNQRISCFKPEYTEVSIDTMYPK